MESVMGKVHSLESFGSADGPGVRFLVFLQGCNMRCQYCHNPDTWDIHGGQLLSPEEIIAKALRYRAYWHKGGGITVSGGEALLQIDFLIQLFTLAKQENIHTCIDTSGSIFNTSPGFLSKFNQLLALTDLFLLDIKHMDDQIHRQLTGQSNVNILAMAKYLAKEKKPMWLRHVLVPGLTNSKEHLLQLKDFINSLSSVEKVELLPYHTLGIFKWQEKNYNYALADVQPPTPEELATAKDILGL